MLYVIGLGLGDEKDITVKGLEAVKTCTYVFLEHYTSVLGVDKEKLVRLITLYIRIYVTINIFNTYYAYQEEFYGVKVTLADRTMVESESDIILNAAAKENTAFLVVGDPFG